MAFSKTGVVSAPAIVPSAFGLLAAVKPENAPGEDQWIRGFAQEWETTVQNLKNWDNTDSTSGSVVSAGVINYYDDIKPFFIELEETRSGLSFNAIDRLARLTRQLEGMTQKAIEAELWDGVVRKGEAHDNKALSATGTALVASGVAQKASLALAQLEAEMASLSNAGENGVIHMTRDVAALLSSTGQIFQHGDAVAHLQTVSGTPVIIGSGYSGNGPTGATGAAASSTNKWIYGTGTLKVYLGEVDVVNDNLAQAYDVSGNVNDMRIKAIRPAAVYFDTSIHLAARVDLSVSAI
jgi:hypothetical protein